MDLTLLPRGASSFGNPRLSFGLEERGEGRRSWGLCRFGSLLLDSILVVFPYGRSYASTAFVQIPARSSLSSVFS